MKKQIKAAIDLLKSGYVQNNLFCLGALGASDVQMAIRILESALEKKSKDEKA